MNKTKSGSFETRMDVRTIATLCAYYVKQGDPPASLGGLLSTALEDMTTILERNKLVERITDTLDAKKLLEATVGRATHRRGSRALIKQIQVETLEKRTYTPIDPENIQFGKRPEEEE